LSSILSPAEQHYLDTCTVLDAIDRTSRFHVKVQSAFARSKNKYVFSEYMKHELEAVLRHQRDLATRRDDLKRAYLTFFQQKMSTYVRNDRRTAALAACSPRISWRVGISRQDVVHIGICGEEQIDNIVSEDHHIYGRSRSGQPYVSQVKNEYSTVCNKRFSEPNVVFTTRSGSITRRV
jgi:hypothetical protein